MRIDSEQGRFFTVKLVIPEKAELVLPGMKGAF
jgi:hypothetical protein